MNDHKGELHESSYSFVTWTTCECGWRSVGFNSSARAWRAHQRHQDEQAHWWGDVHD